MAAAGAAARTPLEVIRGGKDHQWPFKVVVFGFELAAAGRRLRIHLSIFTEAAGSSRAAIHRSR